MLLAPLIVKVPLIVWFALRLIEFAEGDETVATVKLVNVFAPVIDLLLVVAAVLVNATL
jgi:hypothetical protein